ncbi:hypothetical protein ACKKBG_A07645 [Auxenochlorella protothecoides x Auxenochlorella symbiontica]
MLRHAVLGWTRHQQTRQFTSGVAKALAGTSARRLLLAVPAGVGLGGLALSEDPGYLLYNASAIPLRLGRDVVAAGLTYADYAWSLYGMEGSQREAVLHSCHQRGANRLLDLCFSNGGIYIKLGQHVAMLDHLVPAEYVQTMRKHMLNRCPISSWEEVAGIVREDLGAPPEKLFASFSPAPLASASLAQVHEATGFDGRRLAVKVQHRGLRESSSADLATLAGLITIVKWLAPEFDYGWLIEEARKNVPKELDFQQEARNAERCRSNLAAGTSSVREQVVVPAIVHPLSSARVLTMEFMDGVMVTDLEGLARLRVPPAAVAERVSRTFNEMIFRHGDVHCDPHAANMLVRAAPGAPGGWQLVLLDHGLYRQLDDALRLEYAGLWQALIFADEAAIRRHASAMGAGASVPLFAGMLTQRPWDQVRRAHGAPERLRVEGSEAERELIRGFAVQYASEIAHLLRCMPRPLLLLLKTNDCLRAVDRALGTPVNTFVSTARECSAALSQERLRRRPGLASRLLGLRDRAMVESRLALVRVIVWVKGLRGMSEGSAAGDQPAVELPALT